MNRNTKRNVFALVLVLALIAGVVLFCVRYVTSAGDGVEFSGSPHVYSGSNLNTGLVLDRRGTVLLDSTEGRYYAYDSSVRQSTMHLDSSYRDDDDIIVRQIFLHFAVEHLRQDSGTHLHIVISPFLDGKAARQFTVPLRIIPLSFLRQPFFPGHPA